MDFLGRLHVRNGTQKTSRTGRCAAGEWYCNLTPKNGWPKYQSLQTDPFQSPLFLYPPCSTGKAQRLTFLVGRRRRLNHMHLHDAQRALQRFAQTGARYLLTNVRPDGGSGMLFLLYIGFWGDLFKKEYWEEVTRWNVTSPTSGSVLGNFFGIPATQIDLSTPEKGWFWGLANPSKSGQNCLDSPANPDVIANHLPKKSPVLYVFIAFILLNQPTPWQ